MKNIFLIAYLMVTHTLFSQQLDIIKFGAKPGVGIDNTSSIQKAIDEASKTGGTVYFPTGVFQTGTIHLKSNVTIYLSRNAVWQEIASLDKFEKYKASIYTGVEGAAQTNFILAMDIDNITIEGEGTIDGNGRRPEIWNIRNEPETGTKRPWGLHFINCKNIKIKNIFLTNASYWMQRYCCCDHLVVDGIRVFNHGSLNNDAIDIDGCHDVVLSNSTFDADDDAICLKSHTLRDCKDIVITNCIARSHASAIKFGTGSSGGFKNIVISNCVIGPSKATDCLHVLKSSRGLVGLEILCVDGGITENIAISNLVIDSSETPIHIKLGNRSLYDGEKTTKRILRNISLNNIIVRNAGPISSAITGYPGNYIENVSISNLTYEAEGSGIAKDTNMMVEENSTSYPVNRMYNSNLPSYGLYARHVKGLYLSGIIMKTKNNDARSGIVLDDVHNAKLELLQAENKSLNQAFVKVANSSNINFFGDGGFDLLGKYICVSGDESSNILFFNSRLPEIKHPVALKTFKADAVCKGTSFIKLDWSEGIDNSSRIFEYEIFRNGQKIVKTRNVQFTDKSIVEKQKYNYEIIAYDAEGLELNRMKKEIASTEDIDIPALKSWRFIDNQTLEIIFSEPMNVESIKDKSNYKINPGISIGEINLSEDKTKLLLSIDPLKPETEYSINISNLKDCSLKGNKISPVSLKYVDKPVVGYWSFDENKNTQGIKGMAFSPNKSKPIVVKSNKYNLSGNMAVLVWLKLDDPKKDQYYRIISKRKQWNENAGYELEINPAQNRINICGAATSENQQGIVKYVFDDKWHQFVAMIKDGKAIVYVDGILIGEDPFVAPSAENNTDLTIGGASDGGSVFEGRMDELKIYNRSLSKSEIADLQLK